MDRNDWDLSGIIAHIVSEETRYHKSYTGQVQNIFDPLKKGRIMCSCHELGWDTPEKWQWCYTRQFKALVMPVVSDYVEIRFIAGNVNKPVWDGIALEFVGMKPMTEGDVLYEKLTSKMYVPEFEPTKFVLEFIQIVAKAQQISLGDASATELAVLGTALNTWLNNFATVTFNTHTHTVSAPSGVTGPPLPQAVAPTGILSTVVKLK